jgi:hypothetical protein
MKKSTALVIRLSTAFTLLLCRSLVEDEAEKAKSDCDSHFLDEPIVFSIYARLIADMI